MVRKPFNTAGRKTARAGIDRRTLLIGGGAAAGLLIAWGAWPRSYQPNLNVAANETLFNAFLKIDRAGQIIVVVPQLEMGQGVTTLLPQILADELGADWRTVAVQPAPISPLYANTLLADEELTSDWLTLLGSAGRWAQQQYAVRSALMLTGGSTSVRMFESAYRDAGAAARVLLCKAAAARWDIAWEACDIQNGLITDGQRTLKIGELASEATAFTLPDILPMRQGVDGRLAGQDLPRLDLPSKVDGSANFAADIRLPDMVFASIRQGPIGDATLKSVNEAAASKVTGFLKLIRTERWVAVVATNWWAANKALDLADPVFTVVGTPLDTDSIENALEAAFANSAGRRLYETGDLLPVFEGASIVASEYQVAPGLHLTAETPAATARITDDKAEIWMATQAPTLARAAIADALALPDAAVTLYPMQAGGSFGSRMEHDVGVQAALIARDIGRPVQLMWSRLEDIIQDRPRAPAHARMAARLGRGGRIDGWLAKVAAPAALTDIGLPTGRGRSNANHYSAFFTECFIDELAHIAGIEPLSFRIQMLTDQPRLAHCLASATALGGWQGGIDGSGQGLACHAMGGSYAAVMIEAGLSGGRLSISRIVAAVDCGEQVNPDIARQQIEGGLIFGIASAMGAAGSYRRGLPTRAILGRMGLPRLADIGEITVELIRSTASTGGIGEVAVPPVAPAIANALFTVTGQRFRSLPLLARE